METMNQNAAVRNGSYPAARIIARGWHGGGNREMTALSHKREWKTQGLIDEIEAELNHLPGAPKSAQKRMAKAELEALLYWVKTHANIIVIWSDHGHRVTQEGDTVTCLGCGAEFEEVHDSTVDPKHGRWRGRGIREPQECSAPVSHEDLDNCMCLLH